MQIFSADLIEECNSQCSEKPAAILNGAQTDCNKKASTS